MSHAAFPQRAQDAIAILQDVIEWQHGKPRLTEAGGIRAITC
jgi:hypothetical protein